MTSVRFELADVQRNLVVRNTFLEPHQEETEGEGSDDFEVNPFARAVTEPAKKPSFQDASDQPLDYQGHPALSMNELTDMTAKYAELTAKNFGAQHAYAGGFTQQQRQCSFSTTDGSGHGSGLAYQDTSGSWGLTRQTTEEDDLEDVTWSHTRQNTEEELTFPHMASNGSTPPPAAPPGKWVAPSGAQLPTRAGGAGGDLGNKLLDVSQVARAAIQELSPMLAQEAVVTAIRQLQFSLALCDPAIPDCPVIGCSDGFEQLSGYLRRDIVGRNCRFMNIGVHIDDDQRARMRDITRCGKVFSEVVRNRRANGELFQNFLHTCWLCVRGKNYILGVQADVSHIEFSMASDVHRQAVQSVIDKIFASSIDAWVQVQAWEFSIRLPLPYSQLLKLGSPGKYVEEQDNFVRVITKDARLDHSVEQSVVSNRGVRSSEGKGTGSDQHPAALQLTAPPLPYGLKQGEVDDAQDYHQPVEPDTEFASKDLSEQVFPPLPAQVLSKGSQNHPNGCVECSFHFFGPGGCRAGADCKFCHEFHPRRNQKKNRRIIKRLANQNILSVTGGNSEPDNDQDSVTEADMDGGKHGKSLGQELPSSHSSTLRSGKLDSGEANGNTADEQSNGSSDVKNQTFESTSAHMGNSGMQTISYSDSAAKNQPNQTLTLVAGLKMRLQPRLSLDSDGNHQEPQSDVVFVSEPPLPEGLSLDRQHGTIEGLPAAAQDAAVFSIFARVPAVGPAGISLGDVCFAS